MVIRTVLSELELKYAFRRPHVYDAQAIYTTCNRQARRCITLYAAQSTIAATEHDICLTPLASAPCSFNTMATARNPTGFLDLPLELRQSIYTHILLDCQVVYYPLSDPLPRHERTSMAHSILRQEIMEWMYKTCTVVLTITPDVEMDLPDDIAWHRFQGIEIRIDYIQQEKSAWRYQRGPDFIGIKQVIASLLHHQPSQLPALEIWFLVGYFDLGRDTDSKPDVTHPDNPACGRSWYELRCPGTSRRYLLEEDTYASSDEISSDADSDSDDESVDEDGYVTCLKTTSRLPAYSPCGDVPSPLATLMLDHFLRLPPCKKADVYGLDALSEDRRAKPEHHCFDRSYWYQMCEALEKWLRGNRKGIYGMPLEDIGGDGVPVLERLAYMPCGLGKYWLEPE